MIIAPWPSSNSDDLGLGESARPGEDGAERMTKALGITVVIALEIVLE